MELLERYGSTKKMREELFLFFDISYVLYTYSEFVITYVDVLVKI